MSLTPSKVAAQAGFAPLGDTGSYFRTVSALSDGQPVGLILNLVRSRMPGEYRYNISTDGGATNAYGTGTAGDIEGSITTVLILHEAHELRKEVPDR